ncbi:MAG: hypothetical protein IKB34_04375 [Clostridia bacterium]|nr:hypothetical protein [Clostridia bacterium]
MNIDWNNKWKSVLVWLSAYLSFIAFVVVGGYFYIKKEEEEIQTATKRAFLVTLCFTALSAFFSIFNYIAGLTDNYYASSAYDFYSVSIAIVGIVKITVFATFIILALIKKGAPADCEANDTAENE